MYSSQHGLPKHLWVRVCVLLSVLLLYMRAMTRELLLLWVGPRRIYSNHAGNGRFDGWSGVAAGKPELQGYVVLHAFQELL